MTEYVNSKTAKQILGVHSQTLYQWEKKGWIDTIRTPGNHRLYNVQKYLQQRQCTDDVCSFDENLIPEEKMNIIYARVSSFGQKNDLQRQTASLQKQYPAYFLVQDIGSGMNMNRRGFRKMIDWIIEGKVQEVVVMHKDRLARFGFELFEDLLQKYSKGKIIILNQSVDIEPEEELAQDVLQIMNIFVAKMNGMRKYKKKPKL
jgi:putative resolvase